MGAITDSDMSPYDRCVWAIDQRAKETSIGIHYPIELIEEFGKLLDEYLSNQDPSDDIDLLIAYARDVVEHAMDDPIRGDRQGVDLFDRRIRHSFYEPVAIARLEELLEPIKAGAHPSTLDYTLVDLCESGHRSLPTVFMFESTVEMVLTTARDLRDVDALVAAVAPQRGCERVSLGHQRSTNKSRDLAFDLLAELANRPGQDGAYARDELVRLSMLDDSCTEAVVRLPAHLLSITHREKLFDAAISMDELLASDVFRIPSGHQYRMPDAVRSVLWLANDRRMLC